MAWFWVSRAVDMKHIEYIFGPRRRERGACREHEGYFWSGGVDIYGTAYVSTVAD